MDKYKKLISNTLIFAVGTFSSKVLVFLLVPFYTRMLTPEDLSTADLIVQTANLIIPLSSVGMANAIIRFGLDHALDKRDVYTGAIAAIISGYAVFLIIFPFMSRIPVMGGYSYLIYLYVLTASLRSLCSQFVRARQLVKLYAFDGVLSTVLVITFNVLFLLVFKLGIIGYVLATIIADMFSALFLFITANLKRYIRIQGCDWSVLGSMLRYAVPLIPTTVFWWITNTSDRYLIRYFTGAAASGLLAIAYKVPTIINLVSGIFTDAWQMSAFTGDSPGRNRFFSNVFNAYQALIFTAASGLILFCKLINKILAHGEFYESWRFIPFLLLATAFSCFVTFLGSIYMVEKKSVATLVTTMLGALVNIVLNLLLIPKFGVNGGTFATFFSYLVVFTVRIIDTRSIIKLEFNAFKLFANVVILLAQSWILITFETGWLVPEICLCGLIIIINFRQIFLNVQKILFRK